MSLRHLRPRLRRTLLGAALFVFAATLVAAFALRTARRAGDDASEKPAVAARQIEAPRAAANIQPATESETKQEAGQEVRQDARQETKQETKQEAKQDAKAATATPHEARGAKPAADGGGKISGAVRETVEKPLGVRTAAPSLRTAEVEAESAAPGRYRGNRRAERGEAKREEARREAAGQEEQTAQTTGPVRGVKNKPREERLIKAKPFNGDLRKLSRRRPVRKEKPEREGPAPRPTIRPGTPGAPEAPPPPSAPADEVAPSAPAPAPLANFAGLDFNNWGSGHPPDTVGDVGPTYYIQSINSSVGIYNKSNGAQVAAFTLDTFMSQGQFGNLCDTDNFGDPVILYDTFEDRWVITDFAFQLDGGNNVIFPPGAFQCIAVSKTGDPVAGGWNFYSINTTGGLGDYPKFGIWPDGLYMMVNMFGYPSGAPFQNPRVYAFNKAQMYAGSPTVQIVSFDAPASDFDILPSNARLQTGTPPPGTPNYFVSTWQFLNGVGVYKFHVDWERVSLSTFTGPEVPIAATSWPNAGVPNAPSLGGSSLDVVHIRAMMQNQYTNIGGVESLWNTHTVRRANTAGFAAPRWYQVNVTGGTVAPTIPQAATWDPDGANVMHRFVPSLAVDRMGDMALGYSTSSATTKPAIKYAGRLAADPVNTFSQTEQVLIQGTGTQVGTSRWGDYTAMTLDPDGCTFWYTNEYYIVDGFNYQTRIGSFAFPGCVPVGAGGTVSGTVTDGTNPLEGATVALGVRTTTTDASGNYSFTDIPAGTYPSITASLAGYGSSTTTNVVVNDAATTTVNFTLTAVPTSACATDTTQADFQAGVATNLDLTTTPGDVTLLDATYIDQQNQTLGTQGAGFNTVTWLGQTFTPATTGRVTRVDLNLFSLNCSAVTMPDITVSIRNASGNLPTGADLATATIPGFCNGAGGFFTANFATPATLVAGTQYALVWRAAAAIPAGTPAPGYFGTVSAATGAVAVQNPYAGGRRASSSNTGSTWAGAAGNANNDHGFIVYMKDGFAAAGDLVSGTKDANPPFAGTTQWGTLSWNATVPANTTLQFQAAASNSVNGPFNFVGPDGTSATFFTNGASLAQFNGLRYLKYKAFFTTANPAATATLSDVTICFNNPSPTTTALTSDINPSALGQSVTFTATVTSPASGTPTGTVNFKEGVTTLGSGTLNGSGVATFSTGSLSAGSHDITAEYLGDANFSGSTSDPLTQLVIAPSFSIDNVTAAEGNSGTTSFTFTVTKTGAGAASVDFSTADGTATAGSDYASNSGTLTFASGDTTKQVTVLVNGDTTPEVDETFTVTLGNPSNATISQGTGTGTISNDEESVAVGQLIISEFRLRGPGSSPTPAAPTSTQSAAASSPCGAARAGATGDGTVKAGKRKPRAYVLSGPVALAADTSPEANDEFIELYNATDSPLLVTTTDGSAGWAVAASDGVVRFIIPAGTVIPPRAHFLSPNLLGYSLGSIAAGDFVIRGDGTDCFGYELDIPDNAGIALFRTSDTANFDMARRLDAAGSTAEANALYREGAGYPALSPADLTANLEHSFYRSLCSFVGGVGCTTPGVPKDAGDNAADFLFVDTEGTQTAAGRRLGAPGPESLTSPIRRDTTGIGLPLLDGSVSASAVPNRSRSFTSDPANNSTLGTLTIRRRVVNNTGAPVTRLRFRLVELTTFPSPGAGQADLRARTGVLEATVGPVGDAATCSPNPAPCMVSVQPTTLEEPPAQPNGGGYNSTLSAGMITTGTPLANGESLNVNFLLGIEATGTFRFLIIIEALQ